MDSLFKWVGDFFIPMLSKYPWFTFGAILIVFGLISKIKIGNELIGVETDPLPKGLRSFFMRVGFVLISIGFISLVNFTSIGSIFNRSALSQSYKPPTDLEINQLVKNYFDLRFLNSIYGESYNLEEAKKYTTGKLYKAIEGCDQDNCKISVNWLKSRNAYLKYGYQQSNVTRKNPLVNADGNNEFSVELVVVGTYLFYQNERYIESESHSNYCIRNIFKLEKEDGTTWKLSELVSSKPCQSN
jgi:hypothetical protein